MNIRVNYSLCFNYMYLNDDKRQINSKILMDHKKTDLGQKMKLFWQAVNSNIKLTM